MREYEFLESAQLSILSERRHFSPWGLHGAGDGKKGRNLLNGKDLPGKCSLAVEPGDRLTVMSPGGGGWNPPE